MVPASSCLPIDATPNPPAFVGRRRRNEVRRPPNRVLLLDRTPSLLIPDPPWCQHEPYTSSSVAYAFPVVIHDHSASPLAAHEQPRSSSQHPSQTPSMFDSRFIAGFVIFNLTPETTDKEPGVAEAEIGRCDIKCILKKFYGMRKPEPLIIPQDKNLFD
uniref:Uncharacterized protein n=1 Tax=Oryza brachyantha TaxID=4533 RepID=J3MAF4_ORYBR